MLNTLIAIALTLLVGGLVIYLIGMIPGIPAFVTTVLWILLVIYCVLKMAGVFGVRTL